MSGVETRVVGSEEGELRLDRWFRRHFPGLSHVGLQKLLRGGQVRVDGKRAKSGDRLAPGQEVRVPPMDSQPARPEKRRAQASEADLRALRAAILYRDGELIAINKPPGLAVQGGTGTEFHLDLMLDAIAAEMGERPRLVHRLDRDTSGVLLLAATVAAAARLGKVLRDRRARKLYWALIVGVPPIRQGRIDLPLGKGGDAGRERMRVDPEAGKSAVTFYRVLETAGSRLAWVALWPRTGRTHQLRAHMAAIGTPILGDGKYGGKDAVLPGLATGRGLHLHARAITLPRPSGGGTIHVAAPLPPEMAETFRLFGFDAARDDDPFPDLE
ncbi:MAG: RluA family pseudouridine synthase [Alphaproteobacteria bacterium]|nr:RluA family pseudouridine synthase [Alphaproteobacteria bacterium]